MFQLQTDELKQSHQTELEASHNKWMQTELALKGEDIFHLARSANLPIGLYILPSVISSFF